MSVWKTAACLLAASLGTTEVHALNYRADFDCDRPSNVTCYFSVFLNAGAIKNFTLRGGERYTLVGVRPGDTYCVSPDGARNAGGPIDAYSCFRRPVRMY